MAGLPALERRTLTAAYLRALAEQPDSLALIDPTGEWTFAQSFERSVRIAGGLVNQLGGTREAPVAVLMDNAVDTAHVISAIGLGGMIEVPINTEYKGEFLTHVLRNSDAETLVIDDHYLERLARIARDLGPLRNVVVRGSLEAPGAEDLGRLFNLVALTELESATAIAPVITAPTDLIAYMYTSGTTGPAKGVLSTHAQAYTYASREDAERPAAHDRILVTVPLFHLAGQWFGVYQGLIHRIPCIIAPSFSIEEYWPFVRRFGATFTTMLGTMAQALDQHAPAADDAENPLEVAVMAPVVNDPERFARRFDVQVTTAYGSSEFGIPLVGRMGEVVAGECGFARDGYDLEIVDADGAPVAPGEVGELLVRPHEPSIVMAGYQKLPEATEEALRDGWVHTGDGFRRDAEGRFYFADRLRDAIRRSGENVSSFELESVINEYPGVSESAVVAVPSELAEDEIKAVVVMSPGMRASHSQLMWFLVDRLPLSMVPRYIEFVDALPKTPNHKVLKRELRERGLAGQVWDREAAGISFN